MCKKITLRLGIDIMNMAEFDQRCSQDEFKDCDVTIVVDTPDRSRGLSLEPDIESVKLNPQK